MDNNMLFSFLFKSRFERGILRFLDATWARHNVTAIFIYALKCNVKRNSLFAYRVTAINK